MTQTFGGLTYSNGNVPAAILAQLDAQPDAFLRRDAAASWNRGRVDVLAQTGITLTVRGWNRTLAEQITFFLRNYQPQATGDGPFDDVRWWQGTRYVRFQGASVAIPGTSNHGWGLAVDVADYGGVGDFNHPRRVRTFPILERHGWTDTEGRDPKTLEPWHLVYVPSRDVWTPPAPQPAPERNDEMALYVKGDKSPAVYAIDTVTGLRRAVKLPEWNLITRAGVTTHTVPQAELDAIDKWPGQP